MLQLTDSLRRNVNGAIDQGRVLTLAYIDADGRPHATFFGSIHVHAADQLALWVRNPEGGLPAATASRPYVSLVYADISTKTYYRFSGRARVTADPAERKQVYEEMHPIEQKFDPERKGAAVIVDLDAVDGYEQGRPFTMAR